VYLDDIIIFGKNFEEMVKNLRKVLSRMREVNLKINSKSVSSSLRSKILGVLNFNCKYFLESGYLKTWDSIENLHGSREKFRI